ncbi:MAG TPA: heparinase II/III family protein, partial [Alteraurantiacibacter sp.]
FHLGPGIEANLTENGKGAGLALGDGSYWQFLSGEDEGFSLEESLWVDGEGRPHPIQQLVIQGMVSRGGGSFSWLLKKMG